MVAKGVTPKITRMHETEAKVRPIPHDRDNSDDLYDAVEAVHAKKSPIRFPGSKTGTFEPTNSTAYNGNTVIKP